uniref:Endonuclease/exonuclease/phosphatase domain-containing protein n=1 Tax=Schizaphis graminum TaxID=13262 RepID=A0A2S2NNH1_SCHGA
MPRADFVTDNSGTSRGLAWIQTRDLRIYSCYNSRNDTDSNFAAFLADLERSVRFADPHCSIIIGGNLNAWSQEWGSVRNDARAEQLADLTASLLSPSRNWRYAYLHTDDHHHRLDFFPPHIDRRHT